MCKVIHWPTCFWSSVGAEFLRGVAARTEDDAPEPRVIHNERPRYARVLACCSYRSVATMTAGRLGCRRSRVSWSIRFMASN